MVVANDVHEAFAHPPGSTFVVSQLPNGMVVSGGSDGALKTWSHSPLKTTKCSDDELDSITCLAVQANGKWLACALDDHVVKLYNFPAITFTRIVCRLTGIVHSIAFSFDSSLLVVAGDDTCMKLVDLHTSAVSTVSLTAHHCAIRHVNFSRNDKFIVASSPAGYMFVYDITNKCIITKFNIEKIADISLIKIVCSWSNDTTMLAVPLRSQIQFLDVVTWSVKTASIDAGVNSVHMVKFSPNAKFLASTGDDDTIVIWNVLSLERVVSYTPTHRIADMDWSSSTNTIFYTTDQGYLGEWSQVVPEHVGNPHRIATRTETLLPLIQKDGDDEDMQKKHNYVKNDDDDDEDEAIGGDEGRISKSNAKRLRRHSQHGIHSEDDDADNFDVAVSADELSGSESVYNHDARNTHTRQHNAVVHESFQSGASPCISSPGVTLLAWDLMGSITSTSDGVEGNNYRIQILFADTLLHPKISMTDHYHYNIAALGEIGAVFAAPSRHTDINNSDSFCPSTVFYRSFKSWSHQTEWRIQLLPLEEAVCVVAARHVVAVATNMHTVRIFSPHGLQKSILSIDGAIVTMAAKDSLLAIVYNLGECGVLRYRLLDVKNEVLVSEGVVSLGPSADLMWMAFTTQNHLLTMDSRFVFRALFRLYGFSWHIVLDAESERKSSTDCIWPVACVDNKIIGAILKNGEKYPKAQRLPILSTFQFSAPVIDPLSQVGSLEEKFVRERTLSLDYIARLNSSGIDHERSKKFVAQQVDIDSNVIMLIENAMKNDKQARALDLTASLVLPKSIDVALRLSQHFKFTELSKRINLIIEHRRRTRLLQPDKVEEGVVLPQRISHTPQSETPQFTLRVAVSEDEPDERIHANVDTLLTETNTHASKSTPVKSATQLKKCSPILPTKTIPLSKLARRNSAAVSPISRLNPLLSMSSNKKQKRSLFSPSK